MHDEQELVCDLSNGTISNDFEWPVTGFVYSADADADFVYSADSV